MPKLGLSSSLPFIFAWLFSQMLNQDCHIVFVPPELQDEANLGIWTSYHPFRRTVGRSKKRRCLLN